MRRIRSLVNHVDGLAQQKPETSFKHWTLRCDSLLDTYFPHHQRQQPPADINSATGLAEAAVRSLWRDPSGEIAAWHAVLCRAQCGRAVPAARVRRATGSGRPGEPEPGPRDGSQDEQGVLHAQRRQTAVHLRSPHSIRKWSSINIYSTECLRWFCGLPSVVWLCPILLGHMQSCQRLVQATWQIHLGLNIKVDKMRSLASRITL